jgi:ABC-type Co2+ transport system permease subunit
MARGAMHSVIAALALYLLVAITLSHFGATANYEPIRMFDIQDHVSHVHLYGLYDEIELNLAVAYPIILTATSLVTVVATAVGLRAVTRRVSGITGD